MTDATSQMITTADGKPLKAALAASLAVRRRRAFLLVAPLFPFEPRFAFELFELTLLPGCERISEAHAVGVTEHVIVLRGHMEVLVEGAWMKLAEGQAVRFSADRAHGYRNTSERPAVFHNLIHYAGQTQAPIGGAV